MRLASFCFAMAFMAAPAWGQAQEEKSGDQFRITVFHKIESKGDGSSSSSSGGHEYIEQILAVIENGVERLYDLPLQPDDDERLINWQFPVRVFEARDGSLELLNRKELEERRDAWLKAADMPAERCGSWYFTWNAFQLECDPSAILKTIEALKIQPANLIEGGIFNHPAAVEPGRIRSVGNERRKFAVDLLVDPNYFHRADAQNDVVVGEIMKEPISYEDALAKHKSEQIIGTIEVVLTTNADDRVRKRVTSINTTKTHASGDVEHQVSEETVERNRI